MRRIGFHDLFDHIGTMDCDFGPGAEALSGQTVEIEGYLAPVHGERKRFLLVAHPGECPDCAATPTPAVFLPDFTGDASSERLALRGTIQYGFAVDETGTASFLRLTGAERILGSAETAIRF